MNGDSIRKRIWKAEPIPLEGLGSDYIVRYCRAPQPKPIVLVSRGRYWIAENPADPWGSRKKISHVALRELIDGLNPTPWPFPLSRNARKAKPAVRARSDAAERANRLETLKAAKYDKN